MLAYMQINQKCVFENIIFEKKVRLCCLLFLDRCLIFSNFSFGCLTFGVLHNKVSSIILGSSRQTHEWRQIALFGHIHQYLKTAPILSFISIQNLGGVNILTILVISRYVWGFRKHQGSGWRDFCKIAFV